MRNSTAVIGAATVLLLACADRPGGRVSAGPTDPRTQFGPETTPSFTDWITEPTIVNGPITVPGACDVDLDSPDCASVVAQKMSQVTGGSYGFDPDRDGVLDATLTAESELTSRVQLLSTGAYLFRWTIKNLGTGALVRVDCGPPTPSLAISGDDPLHGTAGGDRLPGTGDDLAAGETLVQSQTLGAIALATVLCRISSNPSTKRVIELLVPAPTSQAQCKNGGWQIFGFVDQGQCVRYVETGKEQAA